MIPKIIHYCWFGGNPLPESAKKCIASWRKFLPDYEIKEWNEDNFDVNIIPYTQQAYEAKKYAFVSDYARFWILYKYGGLYFDTDVELIKPMDDIIERGPFMGLEKTSVSNAVPKIAPGLGLGATPDMKIYGQILEDFHRMDFFAENGSINPYSMIPMVTELFSKLGFKGNRELECVAGIYIYPEDVFCPMDPTTGITTITKNTVSIHHYNCSWLDHNTIHFRLHLLKNKIYRLLNKIHLK